ncbi:MAG: hypothetical protein V2A62_02790 [Candidatus Woesearchaeota archaeon]
MINNLINELVQKYCGSEVTSIIEIFGGYRNKVYHVYTNNGELIIKKHRPFRDKDDFKNEVNAYKMLGEYGCRIPSFLFADDAERILGIQKLNGGTLEEKQPVDYYLETINLISDTYQKTKHLVNDGTLSFRRLPEEIFEGIQLLEANGGFNLSESFRNYAQRCYDMLAKTPTRLSIGSFIPSNVIRLTQDYHIDLELVSFGRPSDDLAYFSLYSGVNIFKVPTDSLVSLDIPEDLFLASMMHLGTLASGIYLSDLKENLGEEQRKMIRRRINNFSSVLFELGKPGFEELAERLEKKKW